MTSKRRKFTGIDAKVAIFGRQSMMYLMALDPAEVWCEHPGTRPGSMAVGVSLKPQRPEHGHPDGAIYLDVTREEIQALMAAFQSVLDANPEAVPA